ncbi:MAG: PEGA domain-containing protein [Myxococcales bacterium]|nr:PEGA domain-containing protein [Myxococcales bacterium]
MRLPALLLTCTLLSAPAEPAPGIAYGKGIPERERSTLSETFTRSLPLACERVPCIEGSCKDERSLGVRVDGSDRSYTLAWSADDPALDQSIVLESSCELCSISEVADQLAVDLGQVCGHLDALDTAPGHVTVTAEPGDARLLIDGKHVGHTPWTGELTPGRHILELDHWGYAEQQKTVEVFPGAALETHVVLLQQAQSTGKRPRWPGWLGIGVGLATTAAGVAFIAVDQRPYRGLCEGPDVDAQGDCRYRFDSLPLGIGLTVAGAALLSGGIGVTVWAYRGGKGQGSAGLAATWSF